ncbi:DUF4328 domain-containing protein [Nocardia sp. CA2R105]|uniref:DUF4328 domain-containing protein n=1 Tax=Nocardia coffeae TaxID=2873381 RepID=UPI001CA60AEC|nr:DUF4328 domain-containing protein [Nocardia coffeae]MBY8856188.1 DUF4328 domain-containing protein [Nocardia coffeae]
MSVEPKGEIAHEGRSTAPLGLLGTSTIILIASSVLMLFISAIIDWIQLEDFERSWGNPQGTNREWQSDNWAGDIASFSMIGAGVALIAWLWRARRNAEAICAARHRLPIGWVIGSWFCPVVDIWFPHMIMADVVRASDPRTPADASDLRGRPTDALITVWWLTFLVNWVLTLVGVRLSMPKMRSETTDEYFMYGYAPQGGFGLIAVELIDAGVLAVSAICLGVLIIRVQRWQEARA